ncbi:MAG: S-adenosylmethionine:tRNA ribosyltransferase-isomerase [Cytophagales bacterium]|nr:S-adenosylmethionine:tRNA ribosyltransferase-isomerase [Cytophagales bacterium]
MQSPKDLKIEDFTYTLPDEKIAKFPLEQRDESKLLVYNDSIIQESIFKNIEEYLPDNSTLIFNNTKVVYARLLFQNQNGATIEFFCLEPAHEVDVQQAMLQTHSAQWNCLIGKAKKFKEEFLTQSKTINDEEITLTVKLIERKDGYFEVDYSWGNELTFAEILKEFGNIPLPPYFKRKAEESDKDRYQTVYAQNDGSVAAPTAGLHFTEQVFDTLHQKGITTESVILHVGAGTFQPVKSETLEGHNMHYEEIIVEKKLLEKLSHEDKFITVVGTTSLRTIESLYWIGLKLHLDSETTPTVTQWEPYELVDQAIISYQEAMKAIIQYLNQNELDFLQTKTQLLIAPSYQLRGADAIITNFHQPNSTLLLLVSTFIGEDWKKVYDYALNNDFRFLSYGDSSLLFKK